MTGAGSGLECVRGHNRGQRERAREGEKVGRQRIRVRVWPRLKASRESERERGARERVYSEW